MFQLYPENLDFDPNECKLYIGSNFNGSVIVYDLYSNEHETLTFDGISGVYPFRLSGIDYDRATGDMLFVSNNEHPFQTMGKDLVGPNKLIRYSPKLRKVTNIVNIDPQLGSPIGGFQDTAEDSRGNAYMPSSWGAAILKVDRVGSVSTFYYGPSEEPSNEDESTAPMFSMGIISTPSDKIVVCNSSEGAFYSFDTKAHHPKPALVHMSNLSSEYKGCSCDGMSNPFRYRQNVLLCSENTYGGTGGISVFETTDDWKSATYRGMIMNDDPNVGKGYPTATVQVVDSIYISEFYLDVVVSEEFGYTAGNRSQFYFTDITHKLDSLVQHNKPGY
ncbi:hypothetical protein J3E69DRAFT_357558 [Trichoderma sp. SZMC 28015]